MFEYLKELNNEQREFATSIDGRIFCIACAGAGKTKSLICRVAYMLDNGIAPENILLLTFTNKAAKEMRDRAMAMVGERAAKITASTFHSFCANILRVNSKRLGLNPDFTIIDSPDMMDAISIAIDKYLESHPIDADYKDFPNKKFIGKVYECAVNNRVSFEDVVETIPDVKKYKKEVLEILKGFVEYKKSRNLLDYDDLLFYMDKFLADVPGFRKALSNHYKYICADEYQDTNTVQNHILEMISEEHGNLAVVGDDNQSIYKFRYANIENILGFQKIHPDSKKIVLYTNYRSSQPILDFVNCMMDKATEGIPKTLKGTYDGIKPKIIYTNDCYSEADFILHKIKNRDCRLRDIAVICRNSVQSYILESKLALAGIPFNKYGGLKFMEKKVVKDLLAFLRAVENPKDELAYYRLLQLYPGIGKKFSQNISQMAAADGLQTAIETYKRRAFVKYLVELQEVTDKLSEMGLNEQMDFLINKYYKQTVTRAIEAKRISDSQKREEYQELSESEEDMNTLKVMSEKYKTPSRFLADIVLTATEENEKDDKLNVTTIHSAKGLEYKIVFIMDCIEGVTPRCEEDSPENPEELRCMYVACTRAKEQLYLMCPGYFNITRNYGELSHFISDEDTLQMTDKIDV